MKKVLGIISVAALAFGLYQLVGSQNSLEGEELSQGKSSRWQSAKRLKGNKSSAKSKKSNSDTEAKDKNVSTPPQSKGGNLSSSFASNKIKNPFFNATSDSAPPTWEEAKDFAFRPIEFKPRDEQETALLDMSRTMAATFMVPNSHEKLLAMYEEKGLTPDYSQNSNPHTGKMVTIRTQNTLPGIRYPHTQYFSNERNEMMMQHTSIEYRPGPQAFERVNEMVKELYQVKDGKESQRSKDGRFVKYNLGHGQILWVQQMAAKDLKESPINAYEESDVGTIRMAIEQEIHFEEEGIDPHISPEKHDH